MGCLTIPSYHLVLLTTLIVSVWCQDVSEASKSDDGSSQNDDGGLLTTWQTVRWETDEFGDCSVPCGGGLQHRLIRCVREDAWNPGVKADVPNVLCPLPIPNITQSCNTLACMGDWKAKPWSPCSVTCGEGVQDRQVTCESYLWNDISFQVADEECGGHKPIKFRKCYERDCPHTKDDLNEGTILAENYTLLQIRKAGILKVNVGGKIKLLRGQTVMIKCPTRHFSRRLIYWSKGNKMIPHQGRVKVTTVGLRISNADPKQDRGIYTCMAGERKATINVQFTRRKNPKLSEYRKWAKKSTRRFRRRYPNRKKGKDNADKQESNRPEKVLSYFPYGRQQDQGVNVTLSLSFVTGNWSECSATCGSRGLRHRKVFCAHINSKFIKMLNDEECIKLGITKPTGTRRCIPQGPAECPVWRPGDWSECDPSCGDGVGRKSRILVCEWEASGKPAWNACDSTNKPVTRKPCKPIACPQTCEDSSKKCYRVRQFKMCRFPHFREKCCHSCQDFHHPNKVYSHFIHNDIKSNNIR